jgi:predicted TIM-barrel fold metal-dependent hydrolase
MPRFPWLRMGRKSAPTLVERPPIRLGAFSNGEYFHDQTPLERSVFQEILVQADAKARRLGMERREFLASAMGMATSLSVLNLACGSERRGGYEIPHEATLDCALAEHILNGENEFIFDIQTHHIEYEGAWRTTNPTSGATLATLFSKYNGCQDADLERCIDADAYLQQVFLESDTTVAVLSGFSAAICTQERMTRCGAPLDNDALAKSVERVNALARSQRVVSHCQVNPTDELDLQLAMMERIRAQYGVGGWKTYPEWGPNGKGWAMNDEGSGIRLIEKARELGVKLVCIHKGIVFPGWDRSASDPADVGIVAKAYPDTTFIVYHSAIEFEPSPDSEGVYDPNNTQGTDRLIRTLLDNDLKGKNLYAELGSVWAQVMNDPTMAQHVLGKLLKYFGPDHVLWGSESIWLGSPQPQIEAFRAFQISKEFQETYGYPELTREIRAKIFGLSAAKLYGIEPEAKRCKIDQTSLARMKRVLDGELGDRRWAFQEMGGPRTRREFARLARFTGGKPG